MRDYISKKQLEMLLEIIKQSPNYEPHELEELRRALKIAYNPPCGLSTK
jgi:hypothetical protein